MALFGWRFVFTDLLLACLASFGWHMRKFFFRPVGTTAGTKVIKICGTVFAVLHLVAIVLTPEVTTVQVSAAALMYMSALWLFWWAVRTNSHCPLSAAFSPDTPDRLVERGPYRLIRHPLYSSYLLTWTAGMVATARFWLLPSVAVMLAIYLRAARVEEEKFMRSPLAGPYRRYQSRTGLFFPNPIKLLKARRSWR